MVINGEKCTVQYYRKAGCIIAQGTLDSLIVFTRADGASGAFTLKLGMSLPQVLSPVGSIPQCSDTLTRIYTPAPLEYVMITDMQSGSSSFLESYLKNCIIQNSKFEGFNNYVQCNFINNHCRYDILQGSSVQTNQYICRSTNVVNIETDYITPF